MLLLKTAGVVLAFVLLVPLFVWLGSGSLAHALFALKRYLIAMGVIVVPVLVVFGITLLPL